MIVCRSTSSAWIAALVLTVAITAQWKLRIIDTGEEQVTRASVDTYYEHIPMAEYGFGRMARGDLPLWNPHQLCGIPSLAIPYVGQLYPGNIPYLFLDVGVATEVVFILHQLLAAMSLWLLLRAYSVGPIGAYAGALTYIWAGWFLMNLRWPSIHIGLSWAPATLLAIELTIRRHRAGVFVLAAAVACQLLNGSHEVFVHTMAAGVLFSVMRLGQQTAAEGWRAALGNACGLLIGVAGGLGLSAVQLLPTLELVQESARAEGSPAGLSAVAKIPPGMFATNLLTSDTLVAVGVLPLLLPALGFGSVRSRVLWLFAMVLAFLSAQLVFGGDVYELYKSTPLGGMFRRAFKFLGPFDLAAAIGAGIAVGRLESIGRTPGWVAHRRLEWWAAVLLVAALLYSESARLSEAHLPLVEMLALLLLFALAWSRRARTLVLVLILGLHGQVLFSGFENDDLRPVQRDDLLDRHRLLFQRYADWREGRVLLHPGGGYHPDVMAKQAMRFGFYSISDYQPLALDRHRRFFRAAAGRTGPLKRAYSGAADLTDEARLVLFDLASTRHYLVKFTTAPEVFIRGLLGAGEFVYRHGESSPGWREVLAYERPRALPRAYFVPRSRRMDSAQDVLDELQSDSFDPYREVLVEESVEPDVEDPEPVKHVGRDASSPGAFLGSAEIESYGPERVAIRVDSEEPGYLVLTDTYFPGWRAMANGTAAPIFRANYLFRAVPIDSGETLVVFEYRPSSFFVGAIVSAVTATCLLAMAAIQWRRRASRRAGRELP